METNIIVLEYSNQNSLYRKQTYMDDKYTNLCVIFRSEQPDHFDFIDIQKISNKDAFKCVPDMKGDILMTDCSTSMNYDVGKLVFTVCIIILVAVVWKRLRSK